VKGEADEVSPGSIRSLMGLEAARQRMVGRDGLLDHYDKVGGQVGAERATQLVERAPHLAGDGATARSVGDDHLDGNAAARAQQ
jgi:hypothetical protein